MTALRRKRLLLVAILIVGSCLASWFWLKRGSPMRSGVIDVVVFSELQAENVDQVAESDKRTAVHDGLSLQEAVTLAVSVWLHDKPVREPLVLGFRHEVAKSPLVEVVSVEGKAFVEGLAEGEIHVTAHTKEGVAVAEQSLVLTAGKNRVDLRVPPKRRISMHIVSAHEDKVPTLQTIIRAQSERPRGLAWLGSHAIEVDGAVEPVLSACKTEWKRGHCNEPLHVACGSFVVPSDQLVTVAAVIGSWIIASKEVRPFATEVKLTPQHSWLELYGCSLVGKLNLEGGGPADQGYRGGVNVTADQRAIQLVLQPISDDGSFQIEGLPPGPLWFWIQIPGFERRVMEIQMPLGGHLDLGEVSVRFGRCIYGRVVDEAGKAIGTLVEAKPQGFPGLGGFIFGDGDTTHEREESRGTFVFCELPRGEISLRVVDSRFAINPSFVDTSNDHVKGFEMLVRPGVVVSWASESKEFMTIWSAGGHLVYQGTEATEVRLLPGDYRYQLATSEEKQFVVPQGDPTPVNL